MRDLRAILGQAGFFAYFSVTSRYQRKEIIVRRARLLTLSPQSPGAKAIEAVAEAGREVRRVRAEALTKIKGGLRAVYRTLELPGSNPLKDAHAALDAAVLAAYGFSPKGDLLAQLLALNLEVARHIEANEPVTSPGVPAGNRNESQLVTDDCVRP